MYVVIVLNGEDPNIIKIDQKLRKSKHSSWSTTSTKQEFIIIVKQLFLDNKRIITAKEKLPVLITK